MELTWYGTAALLLREGETTIAFDPFDGISPGELKHPPRTLPDEDAFRTAGHVFVTHGHFDHIYHLPRLYAGGSAVVYCTAAPAATLARLGLPREQLREIAPGWQGTAGPFTVRAYHSRHCKFDAPLVAGIALDPGSYRHLAHDLRLLELNRSCPEAGEILLYEVTCAGFRLQIMGSMNLDPAVDYPTGADLLVLPLQGRSDQDVYALDLVKRLRPKAVALDHWDGTVPPLIGGADVSGFVRNVEGELHIPCRPLEHRVPVALPGREE